MKYLNMLPSRGFEKTIFTTGPYLTPDFEESFLNLPDGFKLEYYEYNRLHLSVYEI
jgi:hypothetical protein